MTFAATPPFRFSYSATIVQTRSLKTAETSHIESPLQLEINAAFLCCQTGIAKFLSAVIGFLFEYAARYVTGQVIAVDGGLIL